MASTTTAFSWKSCRHLSGAARLAQRTVLPGRQTACSPVAIAKQASRQAQRQLHYQAGSLRRPTVQASSNIRPATLPTPSRRTIFIQTESTPNVDALKFKPNHPILPKDFPSPFLEYLSPRSTLAPPHPSPLAASLMNVDGVHSVFFGADYITVTKVSDTNWAHVKPEIFSLITEWITAGKPIVNVSTATAGADAEQGGEKDSLAPEEGDSEVVSMIKELLETRIRPSIQDDGGDIDYRGFENGMVMLKLRGACRTCDSSTVTLKNGIEAMLQHYIPEVEGIQQVLDEEEEVAIREFQKFEERLRSQGRDVPSTTGKGTLDTVE